MKPLTLTNQDIQTCIELASDGINIHIEDQNKIDVIHKVMYAIAQATQHNHSLKTQLESEQLNLFTIRINNY